MGKLLISRKKNNVSWLCFKTPTMHDSTVNLLAKTQKNLNFAYTTSKYGNYNS